MARFSPPPPESGRAKPALNWYGGRIAIAGYGLLCLHIIGFAILGLTDPAAYHRAAAPESGWAENLTAVWYACAGLLVFVVAARAGSKPARGLYLLGGIMLVFFAGEEASWGQHLFNIPVPGWLAEVNYQEELNIHNIYVVRYGVLGDIFRQCRLALCVITIAALFGGRDRLFGVPLPSLPLTLGILAAEAFFYGSTISELLHLLFHRTNILLTLLAVYAIINGQARALPAIVSAIAVTVAVAYTMTQISWELSSGRIYEFQEYLYAAVCLWYALELLLSQGRLAIPARIPRRGLKLPGRMVARRIVARRLGLELGPAVCVLLIAVSIGWALFVYFGYEREDRYFETIYDKAAGGAPPLARSAFDLYVREGRLYYIKEDCTGHDIADTFFLHIYPAQVADLPPIQQQHGFANLDFAFAERGAVSDGKCAAFVELPRYPIARIHTGQYVPDGARLWAVEFAPPPPAP